MDFSQALAATLSPIQSVREAATVALEGASQQDFATYMRTLVTTLADEQQAGAVRQAAGVAFKNSLVSKDPARRAALAQRWMLLSKDHRQSLKEQLLHAINRGGNSSIGSSTAIAQAVAAVAFVEIPQGDWNELMPRLVEMATTKDKGVEETDTCRRVAIETIGFICEEMEPHRLERRSNEILTAVITGLSSEETSSIVKATAARALLHSIDFIRFNMGRLAERDLIMSVVCNATQVRDDAVRVPAFECLTRLICVYYHLARPYVVDGGIGEMVITTLLNESTLLNMKNSDNDAVLMQAIEFWSSICEIEIDLHAAASGYDIDGIPKEHGVDQKGSNLTDGKAEPCHELVRHFLPRLLLPLLNLLLLQQNHLDEVSPDDEQQDDEEWNTAMAAATCLSLVAECVDNDVFKDHILIKFVEANVLASRWQQREAALMALGSVIDGPDVKIMSAILPPVLPVVLKALSEDSSVAVRDTAAWVVGRVVDFFSSIIHNSMVPEVARVLTKGAGTDASRVAVNCCWSLMTMAVHYGDDQVRVDDVDNNSGIQCLIPSEQYEQMLSTLWAVAHSPRAEKNGNLRVAAFQALANVILYTPKESLGAVQKLQEQLINELIWCAHPLRAATPTSSPSPSPNMNGERCGNICIVLANCIRKSGSQSINSVAETVMRTTLAILGPVGVGSATLNSAAEVEDVLMLVGTMVSELGGEACLLYVESLMPILLGAISTNTAHHSSVGMVALGVLGDLARTLGSHLIPYCDGLMTQLLAILQPLVRQLEHSGETVTFSPERKIQPHAVNVVGDLALAVEGHWQKYLAPTMYVLGQLINETSEATTRYATQEIDETDEDLDELDWIENMRLAILNTYTSIIQALKSDSSALSNLAPYVPQMLASIQMAALAASTPRDQQLSLLEPSEEMLRSAMGLVGDLVDSYREHLVPLLREPQYGWLLNFVNHPSAMLMGEHYSESTLNVFRWTQSIVRQVVSF